ncbi:MAG: NUDIX domain-containing protein [Flavobacteriales bacterium]|nr:NUDIX domain-containing protein [Flavobacteriales bacterium]
MEFIDIVDELGVFTGEVIEKNEAHKLGKWHVTAHIWIYNSNGEIMLQKRAYTKDTFPGLWDISVAGHISTGESIELGASREILEEIGLKINPSDLEKIFVHKESHFHPKQNWYNNEFHHVFLLKYDGQIEKLSLQEEEVDSLRFISLTELKKELSNKKDAQLFVGHPNYYDKIISAVNTKLPNKT